MTSCVKITVFFCVCSYYKFTIRSRVSLFIFFFFLIFYFFYLASFLFAFTISSCPFPRYSFYTSPTLLLFLLLSYLAFLPIFLLPCLSRRPKEKNKKTFYLLLLCLPFICLKRKVERRIPVNVLNKVIKKSVL